MNIPNFSFSRIVNNDGYATDEFAQFLIQLSTQLQIYLSNEGYVLPALPTTDINLLTDITKSNGALVYDSTTNQGKININGTWTVFAP